MTFPSAAGTASPFPATGVDRQDSPLADENERWLADLRQDGPRRQEAVGRLHDLLLRAARFETARRRPTLTSVPGSELDDLAVHAANDALVTVLGRLDAFRGASRFTTWAYKFAIYQTSVSLRRRAWQHREVLVEPETWPLLPDTAMGPQHAVEYDDLLAAVREGILTVLTPHQRHVLVALALNGVPIDVLAERLGTTRGALYKTLHDARRKLRAYLVDRDLLPTVATVSEEPR